jgi:hypothetical protein
MKQTLLTFEDYWKEFGKLEDEVTRSPRELEETFYKFAKKVWEEVDGNDAYGAGHWDGFDLGEKEERRRILKELTDKNLLTEDLEKIINRETAI